ncbi:MAG: hypothetical protein RL367_1995 [Pseudomonadota bacterium]|jgi:imidazolonepropionase-like amidohydrolase
MIRTHRLSLRLLAGLSAATLALAGTAEARDTVTQGLVLDRVTVVDVRTGKLTHNRAIVIANGRIVRIVAAGSIAATGAGQRVDGHGAFVVPGFNDMHAHNLNAASPQTSLPLMLASGITGFRQMAPVMPGFPTDAAGKPVLPADSPALLSLPGALLVGPAFANPAAAKAEVDRQKAQGIDFIKVVDLPQAAFLAAVDQAKADGLPISGHLNLAVDPRDAIGHGMDSIEHMGPGISLLLSCSTDEVPIRTMIRAIPPGAATVDFSLPPEKIQRLLANPLMLTPPPGFLVMRRVIATYSEDKCRKLASDIAASKTWVVPTFTRIEAMNLGNAPALRGNPDLRLVPVSSRTLWLSVGDDFDAKLSAEQRKTLADLFTLQLKLAKLFDNAGVKMMAGTDFGGQWIVPGRSLHREFDLLVGTGITPLRILQMTTIDAATYLHREADMGSVAPGKLADLVLLDADPAKRVANLHGIAGVVRAGRFLSRQDLAAMTDRQAAALK